MPDNIEINTILGDYQRLYDDVRMLKNLFVGVVSNIVDDLEPSQRALIPGYSQLLQRVYDDMGNSYICCEML